MARKNTTLGQESVSYSKAIREITGWSKKEFETQKRLMRYRVAKFNAVTGSNLSPIEQLYYRVKYEDRKAYYISKGKEPAPLNVIQRAIASMKTGKLTPGKQSYKEAYEAGAKFISERFEHFGQAFPKGQAILDAMNAGEITPAYAKKKLEELAEEMRELKEKSPNDYIEARDQSFGSY